MQILRCLLLLLAMPVTLVQADSFTVVTSIRPLALLAQDLTQGLPVSVTTLLPANADPHSWALRISDRQLLEGADLILWLGPDFETFLKKPLAANSLQQIRLGDLPNLQWTSAEAHHHDHLQHAGRDLHIWLNPANVAVIQKALAEKLIEQKPDWRSALQRRLQQQLEELEQLRVDIQRRLSPHKDKGFIAYHDAYGHFVEAFDLRQLDAVSQSSEHRLSAKALRELQMHSRNAHCLIVEKNGEQEERTAHTLKLPLVVADGLAREQDQMAYVVFLRNISNAFELCFQSPTIKEF